MRLTLKSINAELAGRGHNARLEKGNGYHYFLGADAADWLDRTVNVPSLSSRTLEQWMDEFEKLKELNKKILQSAGKKEGTRGQGHRRVVRKTDSVGPGGNSAVGMA
jgi:hypothetical protein